MIYKELGKTGIKVSSFGLGCGNFGGIGSLVSAYDKGNTIEESFAIMDAALETGINFFDTANSYAGGRSETWIGKWLKERGSRVRHNLLIATKVFYPVTDNPEDRGLSRKHIFQQVEVSLKRMGIDHIDMYLSHEPDPATPLEETLQAFHDLVQQGKIRAFGACNISAELMSEALSISKKNNILRYEWVQNEYNLLQRKEEKELFPLCEKEQLGFTPFSPLAGGWLSGKYKKDQAYPQGSRMTLRPDPYKNFEKDSVYIAIERLEKHAKAKETDLPTLSLAWLLTHPLVTAPIAGLRKTAQFNQVRNALNLKLTESERNEITSLLNS